MTENNKRTRITWRLLGLAFRDVLFDWPELYIGAFLSAVIVVVAVRVATLIEVARERMESDDEQ
jgi:hypothetical protein